jgi:hypothetical protein
MKNLWDLAAFLLPIVFVLLCIRVIIACIGPVLLPLAALAFIAFVAWLWTNRNR